MRLKKLSSVVFHRVQIIMALTLGFFCMFPLGPAHADPSTFSLLSPEDGASVQTQVLLDWEDSADPENTETLTYTIILSENDPLFLENPIDIEKIDSSCHVLKTCGEDDGSCLSEDSIELNDDSTYYWKVKAMNKYGTLFETGPWSFETDNQNPVKAWIGGHVYNSFWNPISNIIMKVLRVSETLPSLLETDSDGNFCGELGDDEESNGVEEVITIEISAEGCIPKEVEATIVTGEFTNIEGIELEFDGKGDINKDEYIDLKDAVLTLQILAGVPPSEDIHKEAALGEDEKIDMEELIYILQKIVSPSPCSKKNQS